MTRWARPNLGRKCPLEASSWNELSKSISPTKKKGKSLKKTKNTNTLKMKAKSVAQYTTQNESDQHVKTEKNESKIKVESNLSLSSISAGKNETVVKDLQIPIKSEKQNIKDSANRISRNSSFKHKGLFKNKRNFKSNKIQVQNFKCRPENKERLLELKEILSKSKISKQEESKILRKEQDKIKRKERRAIKGRCFKCRKIGHRLEDCPSADKREGTGLCFKCGSTEHKLNECKAFRKEPNGNLPFAKCFICEMEGHLASKCPENNNGIYPDGGSCHTCGSVNHYQKNCPKFTSKDEDAPAHVAFRQEAGSSVDAEVIAKTKPISTKGPRVVIFK